MPSVHSFRGQARAAIAPHFSGDNPLCLEALSGCDSIPLHAEIPSTSLSNWLAILTGAPPATHGVLGDVQLKPTYLDSLASGAAAEGLRVGLSTSPWLLNPIRDHLPPFEADGRVSSAADGTYETTAARSTRDQDAGRRAATLAAARGAAGGHFGLFFSQLTDTDTQGHRTGKFGDYGEAAARAASFVLELQAAMPAHSVLLVLSDHGHEDGGGTGGVSDAVREVPCFAYRKGVSFLVTASELSQLQQTGSADANTHGDRVARMRDVAVSVAAMLGMPAPRHAEASFVVPLMRAVLKRKWEDHARDLFRQQYWLVKTYLQVESLDDGRHESAQRPAQSAQHPELPKQHAWSSDEGGRLAC